MKLGSKNLAIITVVVVVIALAGGSYFIIKNKTRTIPPVSTILGGAILQSSPVVLLPLTSGIISSIFPTSTPLVKKQSNKFISSFSYPYPVNWIEGQSELAITGVALENNELTLVTKIRMGSTYECIPINLRLVLNEEGDMERPYTQQFQFPDSGGCQGTPNATYQDQRVVFSTDNVAPPFWITTGGLSNIYFEVMTTTSGIDIKIPQKSG